MRSLRSPVPILSHLGDRSNLRMGPVLAVLLGGIVASGLCLGAAATPAINCAFDMRWRRGTPAFAAERFPQPRPGLPVLFLGEMAPRGMVILSSPGDAEAVPESMRRVVRAENTSITKVLEPAGAHYRDPAGNVTWVSPEELPALHVRYEPSLPREITFPGPVNCVLLFQFGDGKQDEWREGDWAVSIRCDSRPLNASLAPGGSGSVRDPRRQDDTALIYTFRFIAKPARSAEDRHDLLYFRSLDAKCSGDRKRLTNEALPALDALAEAYPAYGPVLLERAELLAELGQFGDAATQGRRLIRLAEQGQLGVPLPQGRLRNATREEALARLRGRVDSWAKQAHQE